jgi:hypothetical protein
MILSCSTITTGRDLLHFCTAWTLQSLINSHLWSQNKNISEYGGFSKASYTPPMDSVCNLIIIDDGILIYKHYWKRAVTFLYSLDTFIIDHNSTLWSHNYNISEYAGFPIASYTHSIHTLSPQIVIYDFILLYKYYWKRPIIVM